MIDLQQIDNTMQDDINSVSNWVNKIYDEQFGPYFKGERELFNRLQSESHPITDEEINWVLTTLPLQLFTVSEALAQLRTRCDVIKMKNKQMKAELIRESEEPTVTKRTEYADEQLLGNRLLASVYDNVITRVESEISFSRELIMSCKKLFDARRSTENVDPVAPIVEKPVGSTFPVELGDIKVNF